MERKHRLPNNLFVLNPTPEPVLLSGLEAGQLFILEAAHDVVFQRVWLEAPEAPDVVRAMPYYSNNSAYLMGKVATIGGHVRVLPVVLSAEPVFSFRSPK
jgi:hypothetical protein